MIKKSFQNQWARAKSAYWLLKNANLLLCLLVFLLPTQLSFHTWPSFSYLQGIRIDYLSPTLYFTDLLLLGATALFIKEKKQSHQFLFSQTNLLLLTIFFVLLNSYFSVSPILSLYGDAKVIEMGVFGYLLFYYCKKSKESRCILILAFLYGVGLQGILALLQVIQQSSLGWYVLGERSFSSLTPGIANASLNGTLFLRPYGTLPHPNVLGAYALVAVILSHTMWVSENRKIYLASGVLFLCLLLLTLSRSSIIIAFFLGVYVFSQNKKSIWMFLLAGSVLGCIPVLLPRFATIFSDQAISERVFLLKESISLFLSAPFVGVGWHAFLPALSAQNTSLVFSKLQPVHNIYFLLLSEIGIVGITLVGYITFLFIKTIKQRSSLILLFALIGLGINDHYLLTLQQGQFLLAFGIGLILSERYNDSR